jgi:uncharacterized protein
LAPFDSMTAGADTVPGDTSERFLELGINYSLGRTVPQSLVEAHKWLNIAAARGSADARQHRSEIARDMTAAEIAEAQRQARAWLALN